MGSTAMFPLGRQRLFLLLILVNAATALAILLLLSVNGQPHARDYMVSLAYALIAANAAAIPSLFFFPSFLARKGRAPSVPVVIAWIVVFTAFGLLLSLALLAVAGIAVPADFWHTYLHTMQVSAPFALAFGLGVFFYASIRGQLFEARQKLHEREVAEERTRKLALEARLRLLEARVHPHFLFNTLNSISALIATDPARAEMMVGRLAALLRSLLDHTNVPLIPLGEELGIVADYAEIEKARFGSKLRVDLQVPEELRDVLVPPLAVQSLVENAIKHGTTPQRGGGDVLVTASSGGDKARIQVADSGPGFDLASISPGHGLDNLVGRLDALFGDRAGVTVHRKDGLSVVEMMVPRS
jgi:signal transduction histidine kinase